MIKLVAKFNFMFQQIVVKKYLKAQDEAIISEKWEIFKSHFLNPTVQENIRNTNEEQYQEGFMRDLFGEILGYTLNPVDGFNLIAEQKNVKDSKKADGAILFDDKIKAVIELKGTDTTDLSKIESQAFGYKNNHANCNYVITSNFEKVRFYIDNAIESTTFNLFQLTKDEFKFLYLCLSKESIQKDLPKKIKTESLSQEDVITKKLYKDYSVFKHELFANLCELNPEEEPIILFKKSQKLLDRFLFLFFAEDRLLLPPNSVRVVLKQWKQLKELDAYTPLYDRFKKYFGYLNTGFKGKHYDVFAYNGGLFVPDEILDSLKIDDDLLYEHTLKLSEYDFQSEVDVNILGHIFENSLSEIEEVQAKLEGQEVDKSKSKRKKDGVFYTPKYITKYIVENTIGKLCEEKKVELEIIDEEYTAEKRRQKKTISSLLDKLKKYRAWLLQLTIVDPACGSGAFLNEALNFLIAEHDYVDELEAKLMGDSIVFQDIENSILENNLFGVDLNEESVEIAKLSLWLRTAQPNRKLNDLSSNIKCGNSLIDDPEVAGDKAFNWGKEFPQVFQEKKAFHVVLTTHNSRTSQRMQKLGIAPGPVVEFDLKEEIELTKIIGNIITESGFECLGFNVCKDHVHMILVCTEKELSSTVQKIKSISSKLFHRINSSIDTAHDFQHTMEHVPLETESELSSGKNTFGSHSKGDKIYTPLWSQKFFSIETESWKWIASNEAGFPYTVTHLDRALDYIADNRSKHDLPESAELQNIIDDFVITPEQAFAEKYKGGFDVVIGNPPWSSKISLDESKTIAESFNINSKNLNLFYVFFFLASEIINKNGIINLLVPQVIIKNISYQGFRDKLINHYNLFEIVDYGVFPGVASTTVSIKFSISEPKGNTILSTFYKEEFKSKTIATSIFNKNPIKAFSFEIDNQKQSVLNKLKHFQKLNKICNVKRGIELGQVAQIIVCKNCKSPNVLSSKYYSEKFDNKCDKCNSEIFSENSFIISSKEITKFYNIEAYSGKEIGRYKTYENYFIPSNIEGIDYKEEIVEAENLLVKRIATKPECNLIDKKVFAFNTLYFLYDSKINKRILLIILNSTLIAFYYELTFNLGMNLTTQVTTQFLRQIPISVPNIEQPYVEKADQMLSLNKDLQALSNKFQRSLDRQFHIDNPRKKLQTWYELTYKEFLQELEKDRKKVYKAGNENSVVGFEKLTLSEKAEWEDYFLVEQQKAQKLTTQIESTDKEIDQMVYELYGLSEEEIAIVEKG